LRAVEIAAFGEPAAALHVVEMPEPGPPGPGEVVTRLVAAPIDPADLLMVRGLYGTRPEVPAVAGLEGIGRVEAVGPGVDDLAIGDLVLHLPIHNWQAFRRLRRADVLTLPGGIDPEQAAMLKVNPATAQLMLQSFVELHRGDWIVQNAANSAVGQYVARLAQAAGVRTVNIVRRPDGSAVVEAAGGDRVIVREDAGADAAALRDQVLAATGGSAPRLGLDAVAGAATGGLSACLEPGGITVNYGVMSGEACRIAPPDLIFEGKQLRGFWLTPALGAMTPDGLAALFGGLTARVRDGTLRSAIAARYPLQRALDAVAHADRADRAGKILITGDAA
jgi:NADPH:quinone reductase-like Zn-dependent oxidoreductase